MGNRVRFGPKPIALTGSVLLICGLAWMTRLTPTSTYAADLLGPTLLVGLGQGLTVNPLNVLIMSTVPSKDAGAAGGTMESLRQIGITLGIAVLVTVFGTVTRHATDPHTVVTGMTASFTTGTVIAAITLLVALTFRRLPDSGE
jgi:hypothetical protein